MNIEKQPDYRGAFAFIEGYINTCIRNAGQFNEVDRAQMYKKVYDAYGTKPVSKDLQKICKIT